MRHSADYAALSSIGKCLSSWIRDRGHLLATVELYFDGSYSGQDWTSGTAITLAGFVSTDEIWKRFSDGWQAILRGNGNIRPAAKYLHMKEVAALDKEFDAKKGWTQPKTYGLVIQLLKYISEMDRQRFRCFSCTIDLNAWRTVARENPELADPIELCLRFCPEVAASWTFVKYPDLIHKRPFFL